jgi:hypothetical protein
LRHALAGENLDALLAVLDSRRKTTAGTPPVPDVTRALELIAAHFIQHPPHRCRWALMLAGRQEPTARLLACGLLPDFWRDHPRPVERLLRRLADDEHWAVREAAGGGLGRVLLQNFDAFYDRCLAWTQHPSAHVRRAVCIAIRSPGKTRRPEWGEPLLDVLEPLLPDRTPTVRKNLGPFGIGSGMIRWYPERTLARLQEWARREDATTRWNVAMAFSTAGGADHWQEGLPILRDLACDERRFVWRAVASALRVMGRRHPEEIVPRLQSWLDDPQRRRPAQVALGYIEGAQSR